MDLGQGFLDEILLCAYMSSKQMSRRDPEERKTVVLAEEGKGRQRTKSCSWEVQLQGKP